MSFLPMVMRWASYSMGSIGVCCAGVVECCLVRAMPPTSQRREKPRVNSLRVLPVSPHFGCPCPVSLASCASARAALVSRALGAVPTPSHLLRDFLSLTLCLPLPLMVFFLIYLLIMLLQLSHPPPQLHSILPTPSLPHSPPIVHVHGSCI